MSSTTGGSYDPRAIETEMLDFWAAGDYAHAAPDPRRRPFSIVIPPPNVTGALHLGHALNNTLQDVQIRQKRMAGFVACWLPGTDHAGIATQAVVEKRLKEEEGLTRRELGRDGLVERIWAWKDDYNQRILGQLRRMGCSCDWQRTRFTLDDTCARAVYEMFFRMFREGLIYRGLRLVNWDTQLQTAVADDEVYHDTVKSSLWHIRYPVAGRDATADTARAGIDYLVIATTRPETMLADVAVAVHPDDDRYQALIGQQLTLPLMNRTIPVIADGLLVNRAFGTGAVKVTPGHDPNDYQTGLRHKLPLVDAYTNDGHIRDAFGDYSFGNYAGLHKDAARKQIVADLEAAGLLEKIEPYETEVGHSDRSKTPIEPRLSEQWFMAMGRLAEPALEAVRDGRVRFFPERFAKTYLDWLGEKRDWCISRQLWWGHRIPVWSRRLDLTPANWSDQVLPNGIETMLADRFAPAGEFVMHVFRATDGKRIHRPRNELFPVTDQTTGEYDFIACYIGEDEKILTMLAEAGFTRDPDVLDTWFSSALWPFSTWGWPEPTPDLDYFFPTSVLSTARDIISLWVARMVMTSLHLTGRVPFQHVCIHPTIQDGAGKRMSKSAGNGLDPLDLIQHYGADAMRWTLASLAGETQDVRIPIMYLCPHCGQTTPQTPRHYGKALVDCKDCKQPFATRLASSAQIEQHGLGLALSDRFELGRNLCNKLWQATTGFVLPNLAGYAPRELAPKDLGLEDHWLLSRLSATISEVDRRLERYQYSELTSALYSFFWNDYCDWYVELVKPRLFHRADSGELVRHDDASARAAQQVLAFVLDQVLRLMHPIMPFITERLWHTLNDAAPARGIRELAGPAPALIVATWPTANFPREPQIEADFTALQEVIRALRDTRANVNRIRAAGGESSLRTLPQAYAKADSRRSQMLRDRVAMITRLGGVDTIEIGPDVAKPPESVSQVLTGVEVYVPLAGLADLSIERKRLRKEHDELAGHAQRIEGKLANEGFVGKAPADVVDREREKLAELRAKLAAVQQHLAELG